MFGCFLTTNVDKNTKQMGFLCADLLKNADVDLPLKYQDRVLDRGILPIANLIKTFSEEAKDVLNQCENGHTVLYLFYLRFHQIHFLFQINKCKLVPVQGNKTFDKFVSGFG